MSPDRFDPQVQDRDPVLDADLLIDSIELLSRRIYERFPQSGLYQVSLQLVVFSQTARERAEWIARPIYILRITTIALITLLVGSLLWTIINIGFPSETPDILEFISVMEAGFNDIILLGAAIFFLLTLEARIKRRRAMKAIHGLRSLAHIIDMHQLKKDPERIYRRGVLTQSSPQLNLTAFELNRYLDFCSEMLALTGKVAALYIQDFDDNVVVNSVIEVELLTTGLSRKIWQKLMILHNLEQEKGQKTNAGA